MASIAAAGLSACAGAGAGRAAAASPATWNADQVSAIRKRAAFDLSCSPEDVEIVESARDARGFLKKVGAAGCDRKVVFVHAGAGGLTAASWTLAHPRRASAATSASASRAGEGKADR